MLWDPFWLIEQRIAGALQMVTGQRVTAVLGGAWEVVIVKELKDKLLI
jgi:hypothetical protein